MGWNIIGSISDSANVDGIVTDPMAILVSRFFGYSSGYVETAVIRPGHGYWIKVNQQGKIILK